MGEVPVLTSKGKKREDIILNFFLNLEEENLVRKRNEGSGGRFGLTQSGRKPVVTESHASKKAGEGKLFSQQGGKIGKV